MVVSNRPGASGGVGMIAGANARPDGYTLLFTHPSISTIPAADEIIGRPPSFDKSQFTPLALIVADPRIMPAEKILGYMVSARGGDDLCTTHAFIPGYPAWAKRIEWSEQDYFHWLYNFLDMTAEEKKQVFGNPPSANALKPRNVEGKAAMVKWYEQVTTMTNALGLCIFASVVWAAIGPSLMARLYSSATGLETTPEELRKAADRVSNLMKAFNVREGWTRKDDDWPALFYEEPFPGKTLNGALLSRKEVNRLLDDYYEVRGWDQQTGLPTRETLLKLGLDSAADELTGLGRIKG